MCGIADEMNCRWVDVVDPLRQVELQSTFHNNKKNKNKNCGRHCLFSHPYDRQFLKLLFTCMAVETQLLILARERKGMQMRVKSEHFLPDLVHYTSYWGLTKNARDLFSSVMPQTKIPSSSTCLTKNR